MSAPVDVRVLWRMPIERQAPKDSSDLMALEIRARAVAIGRDGVLHVITMPADVIDGTNVKGELSFNLVEGVTLAEQILSGSQRALTQPGAMRMVAATAKVLFGMLAEPDAAEAMREFAGEGAIG